MNINYKQPQFELFPANSSTLEDVNKPKFLLASLTLSIESLVILTILGIMVALFSFSIGVERGKRLTAQALDERVAAAWSLAPKQPMMPVQKTVAKPQAMMTMPMAQKTVKGTVSTNKGFVAQAKIVAARPVVKAQAAAMAVGGRYTIQLSSNKNQAYARKDALTLKAKGLTSFLLKKGEFWLVCVGQFAAPDKAQAALKKIQAKFPGSTVRRF